METLKKGQIYKYYDSENEYQIIGLAHTASDIISDGGTKEDMVIFTEVKTGKLVYEAIENFIGSFNLRGKEIKRFILQPSKIFSREECIFRYCPHKDLCSEKCQSPK